MIDMFKKIMGPNAASIFHPCPFHGDLKILNISANSREFFSVYPEGYYKSIIKFHDDVDENIFTLNVYSNVKSNLIT